jgi:hypothetical protein
MVRENKIKK